jgi:hypothetical protein
VELVVNPFGFRHAAVEQEITEHVRRAEQNECVGPDASLLRFSCQVVDRLNKRFDHGFFRSSVLELLFNALYAVFSRLESSNGVGIWATIVMHGLLLLLASSFKSANVMTSLATISCVSMNLLQLLTGARAVPLPSAQLWHDKCLCFAEEPRKWMMIGWRRAVL